MTALSALLEIVMDEDLRIVAHGLQPFQKQLAHRADCVAEVGRHARDVRVADEIGENPRIEKNRLDVLWRQMEDEAARTRQRLRRQPLLEIGRELLQGAAADPEREMLDERGRRPAAAAKQLFAHPRDKIDPRLGERRNDSASGGVKPRQQVALGYRPA